MINGLLSSAGQMPVDTRVWGEFVAKDLFGPSRLGKYHNPSTLHESDDGYEFICASVRNNGINHAMPKVDGENLSLTPPNIIAWGKQSPFFTYHENPCVTSQGMYFIEINDLTRNQIHFVITILNKLTRGYNYTNCLIGKKFDELSIPLPLKPGTDEVNYTEDDIDWAFMESYIHELEESYIQELDAYLKETGLDDYTLTDDEREVLERGPVFKEFEVTTLFDIVNTKSIRQSDVREQLQSNDGSIPYITASDKNNAIAAYIECLQEWIDKGNCIFIGGKTTTVTYQSQDFCSNDSHNLALYLKNEQARTEHVQLYLVSILKKAFANKYQWSNALSKTKIKNETIQLPVKPGTDDVNYTEDDIDWDYMTAYARVMEKQVIADVVDYKNEMIETTKVIVKK